MISISANTNAIFILQLAFLKLKTSVGAHFGSFRARVIWSQDIASCHDLAAHICLFWYSFSELHRIDQTSQTFVSLYSGLPAGVRPGSRLRKCAPTHTYTLYSKWAEKKELFILPRILKASTILHSFFQFTITDLCLAIGTSLVALFSIIHTISPCSREFPFPEKNYFPIRLEFSSCL